MLAGGKLKPGPGNFGLFEIDEPKIEKDDDVLFRVTSVGICGTDVSIYKWTETAAKYDPVFPLVTGHEMSGIVEQIGKGVTQFKVGDHVTVNEHIFCDHCDVCAEGRTNVCKDRVVLGCHVNGAMTRKFKVRERNVFKVPDNIPTWAGSLAEPLSVSLHAVEMLPSDPDDIVVVFGVGTVGLGVILKLVEDGVKTIFAATRHKSQRLDLAEEYGAIPVAMEDQDLAEVMKKVTGKDLADKTYECTGAAPVVNQCIMVTKPGGKMCQVGIPGSPVAIPMGAEIAMNEKTIVGTRAFYHSTWPKTLKMMEHQGDKALKLVTHRLPLEEFASGIDLITSGEAIKVIIEP